MRALVIVALLAGDTSANRFEVAPTSVALSASNRAAMLDVSNHGSEAMRFQVTVATWTQDRGGVPTYTVTTDVEAFPTLFEVAPGATKHVRVGTRLAAGATERAYRVFVEELPHARPAGAGVQVVTRMAIPIFIAPVRQTEVISVSIDNNAVVVSNTGTLHVRPTTIRIGTVEVPGWYVLPGDRRRFQIAASCASRVELVFESGPRAFTASCK